MRQDHQFRPLRGRRAAGLVALGLITACGNQAAKNPEPPPRPVADLSGKFTFEPRLGTTYHHTMRRTETFEIVGTEFKGLEEWESGWVMSITPAGDNYVYRAELDSLSIQQNGAVLLEGPEVHGKGGLMELTMDPQGRIVDVTQTETLTRAIAESAPQGLGSQLAAMFSPERLRLFFAMRASERTQDLLGQSARVGASWTGAVPGPDGTPLAKKVTVRSNEDCGQVRCVRVERTLHPDRGAVWSGAEARVRDFVVGRGGDPRDVELLAAEIKLIDELVVDPRTMEFHHARFEQSAALRVRVPSGEYDVKSSTVRESEYRY